MISPEQNGAVAQQLIDRHFDIWNDTDSARRMTKFASLYTAEVLAADYAGMAVGYAQLDRMITTVQGKFPGFRFSPAPVAWNHGVGRVTWGYGPERDPQQIHGEDIFTIEDGKIASLRVFIDKK